MPEASQFLTTAFVVGFVIEEQEQRQSAEADPARYSLAERDERLGDEVPLVKAAGHVRDHGAERFERHLRTLLAGVAAEPQVAVTQPVRTRAPGPSRRATGQPSPSSPRLTCRPYG